MRINLVKSTTPDSHRRAKCWKSILTMKSWKKSVSNVSVVHRERDWLLSEVCGSRQCHLTNREVVALPTWEHFEETAWHWVGDLRHKCPCCSILVDSLQLYVVDNAFLSQGSNFWYYCMTKSHSTAVARENPSIKGEHYVSLCLSSVSWYQLHPEHFPPLPVDQVFSSSRRFDYYSYFAYMEDVDIDMVQLQKIIWYFNFRM